jgi:hypothetical protein
MGVAAGPVLGRARAGALPASLATVKDLAAGSRIAFDVRGSGMHALRGVPGDWELFAAKTTNV